MASVEGKAAGPPAYVLNTAVDSTMAADRSGARGGTGRCGSGALLGWAIASTTALVVVAVLGGVYYWRTADLLQETIKYAVADSSGSIPVTHSVEVNSAKNVVVLRLTDPDIATGTFSVLDYTKSMVGLYEPTSRMCYLIGGMISGISDLQTLQSRLMGNMTNTITNASAVAQYYYGISNSYPISDKTILPIPMQSACASLPVYWLEPITGPTNPSTHAISKRSFWSSLFKGFKKVVKVIATIAGPILITVLIPF